MGKRHNKLEAHVLHAGLMAQPFSQLLINPHQGIPFQRLLVHGKGDVDQSVRIEACSGFEEAYEACGQQAGADDHRQGDGHLRRKKQAWHDLSALLRLSGAKWPSLMWVFKLPAVACNAGTRPMSSAEAYLQRSRRRERRADRW